ncbi:lysozyme C-like [Vulpes vulpes]|uniref:Lysozyme C-like n=1 Tax=Vulpes vulpes TaxID=9627 RepID=A0ABM4ZKJ2_VULVU
MKKEAQGSSFILCCIRDVQSNVRVRRAFSGEGGHFGFDTCTDLSMPHGRKIWHRSYRKGILLMRMRFSTRNQGLCLAFVESRFNISKGHENTDGSFDYGIFQIYRHFCCKDYRSHSENICHEDCQG